MKINYVICLMIVSMCIGSLSVSAYPKEDRHQPRLIGQRKSLLLVQSLQGEGMAPIVVETRDDSDTSLDTLNFVSPSVLPAISYYRDLDDDPEYELGIITESGSSSVIYSREELIKLSSKSDAFLKEQLVGHSLVKTIDGVWGRDIYLPLSSEQEDEGGRMRSSASYNSVIYYGARQVTVSQGQTLQLKVAKGQWLREEALENNHVFYAPDIWSDELPVEWNRPGLNGSIWLGNLSKQSLFFF